MTKPSLRIWRVISVLTIMAALIGYPVSTSYAAGGQSTTPAKTSIKIGDKCERKTDRIPGAIKRDGCGRWYCGRADLKDIAEIVPNIEKVAHCRWQLKGTRCLCVKTG